MSDTTKVEEDIHKPFSIKMDDHARQEKLMQFLRRQNKIFNYGLVAGEVRPPTTGPVLGGPDLTLLIRGDRLAVHSLLFWFHCRDFAQWLQKHRCVSLPALVDLRDTELTYQAMRNIVDWVYEEEKDILLDMASAVETMYAAAYFGVEALLKIVQDYSLQVSLRKPKILLKWLNVAEKFECDSLYKNELYHMAATYFQSLLKVDQSQIGQVSSPALINLLRREDLNVQTETDAFKMALIWIKLNKGQSEKRAEIDSILQSIRFVTMPLKEKELCREMVDQEDPEILDLLKPHIMLANWHQTCKTNDRQQESDLKEQFRKHVLTGILAPAEGSSGGPKIVKTPVHLPLSSPEYPPGDLGFDMNSGSGSLALPDPESSSEVEAPVDKEESTTTATQKTAGTKIERLAGSAGGQSEAPGREETPVKEPSKLKEQERKENGRGLPSLQDAEELRKKRQQSLEDINRARKKNITPTTPDRRPVRETLISAEDYGRRQPRSESKVSPSAKITVTTTTRDLETKADLPDTPTRPLTSPPVSHRQNILLEDQKFWIGNVSKIVDVEQQQKAEIIDSGQPVCFHFETTQTKIDPQGKKCLTTFKYDFKNPDSTTSDASKNCKHKHLWKTAPSKRG